jgi:hypothetical protein
MSDPEARYHIASQLPTPTPEPTPEPEPEPTPDAPHVDSPPPNAPEPPQEP